MKELIRFLEDNDSASVTISLMEEDMTCLKLLFVVGDNVKSKRYASPCIISQPRDAREMADGISLGVAIAESRFKQAARNA